jgi:NADH:ubiquinone oxidoreductase subunit F (NADH-binding)
MTATLSRASARPDTATWTIGAPRLLAGLDRHAVLDARAHLAVHGPLPGADLARLLNLLEAAGLTGRGGAGFPLAAKLRALHGTNPSVVVNGSESEPASRKDRTLLRRTPHLVVDGALAVAAAIGTRRVTVAVHDPVAATALAAALAQRPDGQRVQVRMTAGGFVAGEARALVRGLNGGPALPPGRHEHLTDKGVLVANAETFAQTAVLLRLGAHRFGDTGTRAEPGTTLLTIGGAVGRPGVVEIPLGTPLGIVLAAAQAHDTRAVVTGGYHGRWLAPIGDILLSRAGLDAAGATLGAGVLLAVDGATCALGELAQVAGWLAGESAKQCGPCRFGLPALAADVRSLYLGNAAAAGNAFAHARAVEGRGACKHPDGAAGFVTSGLHLLREEAELHLRGGCGRPVLGRLPIAAGR